ncbi:AAA family ATPase [Nocardiopsis composta]
MRLHRLTVQAFGPFAGAEEVDFDRLGAAGLFLVHGPTGAGKTSVLDAVCFALYGGVPGVRGAARSLQSTHAPPDLRPEVALEFTVRGRRLRITRSPAWRRPKKRGSGTTEEKAKVAVAEHTDGTWRPITLRPDEAGQFVSDLLGVNLKQFCQVVLLPQGSSPGSCAPRPGSAATPWSRSSAPASSPTWRSGWPSTPRRSAAPPAAPRPRC